MPEYAEYLERIEALVAVVNHRHGTTDWMPIDLRLRENLEEAIAAYKHYDLLMVNAMFDGMNLIAKEGPLVNERHGVSLLSENTGAHEELAEFALSVNPFDVQEQADAIHRALTMSADERSWRAEGLKRVVQSRDPGDWVDDQLADIEEKRGRQPQLVGLVDSRQGCGSGVNSPARGLGGGGGGGAGAGWARGRRSGRRAAPSSALPLRRGRVRALGFRAGGSGFGAGWAWSAAALAGRAVGAGRGLAAPALRRGAAGRGSGSAAPGPGSIRPAAARRPPARATLPQRTRRSEAGRVRCAAASRRSRGGARRRLRPPVAIVPRSWPVSTT